MNVPALLLWGTIATIVLTTIEALARPLGWSRMSIPFIVGTAFTKNRDRADAAGFVVHFVNGILFAALYAWAFESLRFASWWLGALMGLVHGLFILAALMPLLPSFHPRMADETYGPTPTRMLQPAGFLALNYGRRTAVVAIVAHIIYGAILGAFYTPLH
jgi:uncharacterized membrane protein YagU involved in acid resistance